MADQVGVRNVIDQRDVVAKLFDFLGGVRNATFALALVQALAALLLISNTVQVAAFTRRTEVGIMRLVGATRWYTQLPFMIEAVVAGLVGAVLAIAGLLAGKFLFVDQLLAGIVPTASIPPIEVADIVWVSPILVMVGAGDRRRHRVRDPAAVRAALIRRGRGVDWTGEGDGPLGDRAEPQGAARLHRSSTPTRPASR